MSWTEYYTVPAAVRNHKQNGSGGCPAPFTSKNIEESNNERS